MPGKYFLKNCTMANENVKGGGIGMDLHKTVTPQALPNGIYRHVTRMSNEEDRVGVVLYFHFENYDKMGENTF